MTGPQLYQRTQELLMIELPGTAFGNLEQWQQDAWNQLAAEASAVPVATEIGSSMQRERYGW